MNLTHLIKRIKLKKDCLSKIKNKLRQNIKDKWLLDELTQLASIRCIGKEVNDQYINLTIRSVIIDYFRKLRIEHKDLIDLDENFSYENHTLNSNILFQLIDKLPEKQKETVILKYFFNIRLVRIARLMNSPVSTIQSHNHKAKNNLKKLLTKTIQNELY